MQKQDIKTHIAMDDIFSFQFFNDDNTLFIKKNKENSDNNNLDNENNEFNEMDEDEQSHQSEQDEEDEEEDEEKESINKEDEGEEGIETEEEKTAMQQLRNFSNVAFSRFSGQKPNQPQSIDNNQFIPKTECGHQSIPFKQPRNYHQSMNQFCQYKPNVLTASTFHSSGTSSKYSTDAIHRSMPIRPGFTKFGFKNPQRGSLPFKMGGFNNYPMNYYYPQSPMVDTNSNSHNSLGIRASPIEKKKKKKASTVEDFNSLDELLASLKNGKQIGNYVKARTNSGTMMNLIKKLPPNQLSDLIEMIKPKLKEIMITNNKFSQRLFEKCNSEQRLAILKTIKHNFIEIALNKWGSYALQALIKVISLPEEQEIVKKCIEGKVYELAMDKQANFVLQKLIVLLNEKVMSSLTDEIFDIFPHLIYNSTGLGLLKNLVLTNKGSEIRRKFVLKIIENMENIINNSAGHTLLLQMMEKWDYETCKPMIVEILKEIPKYCMMKYSYLILLKCISIADVKTVKNITAALFRFDAVFALMKTDNGNALIKELFIKLNKKGKTEVYHLLESNLALYKESTGNDSAAIPDYLKELMLVDD